MGDFAARAALCAAASLFAALCSGCAWWARPAFAASGGSLASYNAPAPTAAIEVAPDIAPPARPLPTISHAPEDFYCIDGSWLRVSYPSNRDTLTVSVNGSVPFAMRRADEAGLIAYRAGDLVLRRSGVRVALASGLSSVTVRSGDTLGLIALRIYGDRTRATDIARLNNIENPDLIFPGQVLGLASLERRCRRMHLQTAASAVDTDEPRQLDRRLFSPPSARQPDQRRIRATASDPPTR